MERTDIHRPAVIVPEDYEFVAFDYIGESDLGAILMLQAQREILRAHQASTGGKFSSHEHGGTCYVCGTFACYLCTWYHDKSNTYIQTGEDCARKLDMSCGDMNAFRRAVSDAREAQAGKKKARAILADRGISAAWDIFTAEYPKHTEACDATGLHENGLNGYYACTCDVSIRLRAFDQYEERTIRDIVSKVVRFGSISDKAAAYVKILLDKIPTRAAVAAKREATRAAETEAAAPVPSGRVIITGHVLAVKEQERQSYYHGDSGTDTKLLVQGLTGFKVWGNQFMNAQKGDLITFTATVKPSDKDPKFGFFSRPTKGSFVNEKTGEIIPSYPLYQDEKEFPTPELLAAAQDKWRAAYGEVK